MVGMKTITKNGIKLYCIPGHEKYGMSEDYKLFRTDTTRELKPFYLENTLFYRIFYYVGETRFRKELSLSRLVYCIRHSIDPLLIPKGLVFSFENGVVSFKNAVIKYRSEHASKTNKNKTRYLNADYYRNGYEFVRLIIEMDLEGMYKYIENRKEDVIMALERRVGAEMAEAVYLDLLHELIIGISDYQYFVFCPISYLIRMVKSRRRYTTQQYNSKGNTVQFNEGYIIHNLNYSV